jgi:DNA-binding HxlR family transcriptional regulator
MPEPADCPTHDVQRLIAGKWCLVALWHLKDGRRRFAELERAIGNVSAKALTESLRHLEREGFVARTVFPEVPPRVEYELTPLGTTLLPILDSIQAWAIAHRGQITPREPRA